MVMRSLAALSGHALLAWIERGAPLDGQYLAAGWLSQFGALHRGEMTFV